MLCTVAEKTIKLDFDAEYHPALKAFFNRCRKLNQEVRVVVAHGVGVPGEPAMRAGSHLRQKMHFEKPENLVRAAVEAVKPDG